ncbi:hypothetical protein ACIGW7_19670 [Streptomyces sp. NPDC053253]|uniref:hypothetical protein n=1 Tax=Streptomyces sp. NPDC053253 TaxID=3365699 RepID=UPI0037CFA387
MTDHYLEFEDKNGILQGYTLYPPPDRRCCPDGERGLSLAQARTAVSFHEAGHAVVGIAAGIDPRDIEITQGPPCTGCDVVGFGGRNIGVVFGNANLADALTVLAAGVQAELLWLTREDLLTPARGWAAEAGGIGDQAFAQEVAGAWGSNLDYTESPVNLPGNYRWRQRDALLVLADRWPQVTAVAAALAEHGFLSSAEVSRLARPLG